MAEFKSRFIAATQHANSIAKGEIDDVRYRGGDIEEILLAIIEWPGDFKRAYGGRIALRY